MMLDPNRRSRFPVQIPIDPPPRQRSTLGDVLVTVGVWLVAVGFVSYVLYICVQIFGR